MAAATRSNLDYAMIAATFTFWPLGKIVTHLPYPCAQKRLYSLQSTLYTKRTGSVFDKLAPTSSWSSRSNLREEARSLKTTLKPVCMCARNVDTSCSAAGLNTSTLPRGRPSPRPSARIACPKRRRNGEPTRCPVGSVGMDLATSS